MRHTLHVRSRAHAQGDGDDPLVFGALPAVLPPRTYALAGDFDPTAAALGWALGSYKYIRYKSAAVRRARTAADACENATARSRAVLLCRRAPPRPRRRCW
jgi:leucyl aminopeptidase